MINLLHSLGCETLDICSDPRATSFAALDPECSQKWIYMESSKECFDIASKQLSKCLRTNNSESESRNESRVGNTSEDEVCSPLSLQKTSPFYLHCQSAKKLLPLLLSRRVRLQVIIYMGCTEEQNTSLAEEVAQKKINSREIELRILMKAQKSVVNQVNT